MYSPASLRQSSLATRQDKALMCRYRSVPFSATQYRKCCESFAGCMSSVNRISTLEERSVLNCLKFFGQSKTLTLPAPDAGGGHRHGPTPPLWSLRGQVRPTPERRRDAPHQEVLAVLLTAVCRRCTRLRPWAMWSGRAVPDATVVPGPADENPNCLIVEV